VNQVYWHARSIFDRLQRSGADLRRAQIAALEGRTADVHSAAAAHRKAVASAVEQAMTLAQAAQANPDRDAVARTFEALSIASDTPEPPGRLTHPLRPGGFELLAGVEPVAKPSPGGTAKRVPLGDARYPPGDGGDGLSDRPEATGAVDRGTAPKTPPVGDGLRCHRPAPTARRTPGAPPKNAPLPHDAPPIARERGRRPPPAGSGGDRGWSAVARARQQATRAVRPDRATMTSAPPSAA
jgi:hypothetical protein